MAARRKSQAAALPQSRAEAEGLILRYAALSATVAAMEAKLDAELVARREAHLAELAPIESELKDLFARLRGWWAVAGPEIAGTRRSAEMVGVEIGVRRPPPLLVPRNVPLKQLIARMLDKGLIGWLRIKYELDKPGIVAKLLHQPEHDLAALGFWVSQKDEFFIALRPVEAAVDEAADAGA